MLAGVRGPAGHLAASQLSVERLLHPGPPLGSLVLGWALSSAPLREEPL